VSLADLAAFGSFIGGVAVIVSFCSKFGKAPRGEDRMLRTRLASFVIALALAGCVSETNWRLIEAEVAEFHARQANGEDAAILEDATPNLRQAASNGDLTRLNNAVRAVPGCAAAVRQMQWNTNVNAAGHFITTTFRRACANDDLFEEFQFQMIGGQAVLNGYNVSGIALFPEATPASPNAIPDNLPGTPT